MCLLVRGANMGVDLTLALRLVIFLILCQYFLISWFAFRAVGEYLVEKMVLCEAFLVLFLFMRTSLSLNCTVSVQVLIK